MLIEFLVIRIRHCCFQVNLLFNLLAIKDRRKGKLQLGKHARVSSLQAQINVNLKNSMIRFIVTYYFQNFDILNQDRFHCLFFFTKWSSWLS